jgi:hypothetical protein
MLIMIDVNFDFPLSPVENRSQYPK